MGRHPGQDGGAGRGRAGVPVDRAVLPDLSAANPARMYDYYLGGRANFAVDRATARQVITAYPGIVTAARANRAFLRRAVDYLTGQGITQFLDLGSGIPTVGNVHQIAQQQVPGARVVYVDIEPVAVAHSAAMLAGNPHAGVIRADVADPGHVLGHPVTRGLLDLTRPVGVLMVSVLNFIPDTANPHNVVAAYRDTVTSGSFLAITHGCTMAGPHATAVRAAQQLYQATAGPVTLRTTGQIRELFTGFDLVAPGLVPVTDWRRPDEQDDGVVPPVLAGVGVKPPRVSGGRAG